MIRVRAAPAAGEGGVDRAPARGEPPGSGRSVAQLAVVVAPGDHLARVAQVLEVRVGLGLGHRPPRALPEQALRVLGDGRLAERLRDAAQGGEPPVVVLDDVLDAALEVGWSISFAGVVSFHDYEDADRVRAVPDDRLLIETDSPYLTPVPRRGKRNEPAFVRHVAEAIARWRGVSFESVAERTSRNARAFYGIREDTSGGT